MEKTRKWKWGVNRWFILLFVIFSIIGVNLFKPVQPNIQVAAENLTKNPVFVLPVIGEFRISNTMTAMVLLDIIVIGIALAVRSATKKAQKNNNLVPSGISGVMETGVEALYNMAESTTGKWTYKIFPWFASILIIVLIANLMKLIPGVETIGLVEESAKGTAIQSLGGDWYTVLSTKAAEGEGYVINPFVRGLSTDLNFTVALALISVFMTQVVGIQAQGFKYFSKFLNFKTLFKKPFFGFIDFAVGLLETISEFAKILSFSFRLFGNMFAGMVLMALIGVMLPVFMPSLILAFEFFIGAIQAFVFGMLTMVFMAQATSGHGDEEHHEEAAA